MEALVAAGLRLLKDNDLPSISLHNIAAEAGIPPSSAYHFFASADAVFAEIARRFGEQLIGAALAPYEEAELVSWETLFRTAAMRGVALYERNPGYCRVILGATTKPDIKSADRENDFELGRQFYALMGRHFILPAVECPEQRMFHAIAIFDLFLCLSYQREGFLKAELVEDGLSASTSYLRQFIPPSIPRREYLSASPESSLA
ncbi:MAG: TetR/AcrR family transcriptional regulator [Dinoroseobacter sp.]|nr:TetR/AcrR family transcriptional regulator [Dinoroseobacter sp.]